MKIKNFYSAIFIVLLGVLMTNPTKAQVNQALQSKIIEQRLEFIAEGIEQEEVDFITLTDVLNHYFEHPINLNGKNAAIQLAELELLSDQQINNFTKHITQFGKLISIYELQAIEHFDLKIIQLILPFVSLKSSENEVPWSWKNCMKNGKHSLLYRYSQTLEEQKGYRTISDEEWLNSENTVYLGSSDKQLLRYRFQSINSLSIGFTLEKDAGERLFENKKAQSLFGVSKQSFIDFSSFHLYAKNIGKIKSLAIGDYQLQLGQGLTLWSGLAFGKSAQTMNFKRNATGLRPFRSVEENNLLRGIATTLEPFKNFTITAFVASKNIDANLISVQDTVDETVPIFSNLQHTGLHNTIGTYRDRKSIHELKYGLAVAYRFKKLNIGINSISRQFNSAIENNSRLENIFTPTEQRNFVVSTDYDYSFKNFTLFGEVAASKNKSSAQIHGVVAALDPKFSSSIIYRKYDKEFSPIQSNALSEGSTASNESGVLFGIESKIHSKWKINGYIDLFKFPWLKYLVHSQSTSGTDLMVQTEYKHSKKLEVYARIRQKVKSKNEPNTEKKTTQISNVETWNYRINLKYAVSKNLTLRSRAEFKTYKQGTQENQVGFLVYQDILYKPFGKKTSFSFRYALFDTESFNARIYSYEPNVLYAFSIPAYNNTGTRTQFTLCYKPSKRISFWLRWAQWNYSNLETIGSGLNEISGNRKTDITIQMRINI